MIRDYKTVSILVLPTDPAAEDEVDRLFAEARQLREPVVRRKLNRAQGADIMDEVYAPKK